MKFIFLSLAFLLGVVSCAPPPTPSSRIGQNFDKFSKLSLEQKKLVRRGEIEQGMPTDAVFIAWGSPSDIFQFSRDQQKGQRWDYSISRPVRIGNPHPSFYGCRSIMHSRPDVAFVPDRVASVWFKNGIVSEWERKR